MFYFYDILKPETPASQSRNIVEELYDWDVNSFP